MASHTEASQLQDRKRHAVARAAMAIVVWGIAALLVALVHQRLDAASPVIRVVSPEATLDHALFVGTTWVLLAIAAEIIMTASSGRQWFALLGSPAHGGLRCVLLIAWVIAPALFASHRN